MRWFTGLAVGLFSLISLLPLHATAEQFEEGVHYQLINPPQPTTTGSKVEVLEVFWYGCPHCFRFEPTLQRWLKSKPAEAEFVRMPGVLNPQWEVLGRAYYAAEILGVFDKVHEPLFNAIHQENRNLKSEEQLADFFAAFGVKKDDFLSAYNSFAVNTKVSRAKVMAGRYGIDSVPTMIVNGKYIVNNRSSGGPRETMDIVNFLVKKESGK